MLDYVRYHERSQEEIVAYGLAQLEKAGIYPESTQEKAVVLELLAETFMEAYSRRVNV